MKIIPIFAPYLYAIAYPREFKIVWNEEMYNYFEEDEIGKIDEFQRLFTLWSNPRYLYDFFKDNAHYLNAEYWLHNKNQFTNLPKSTKNKARKFEETIVTQIRNLDKLFQPLDDNITVPPNVSNTKSKYGWLRVYAINIDENKYLVTGGAIKLTKEMKDHPMTKTELKKMEIVRNFLIERCIIDSDSYEDYLYELTI